MKNVILTVLRTGYSTTKKYTAEDLSGKLYFLKHIIENRESLGVCCNNNPFWRHTNNANRDALIRDIECAHRLGDIRDTFHIHNRFANGDKYGIEEKVETLEDKIAAAEAQRQEPNADRAVRDGMFK